jgi:1-acyl-sn-glycerol-3-phosphate acyltransferase
VPFLGWHLGLAGHIRVHRKDKTRNKELPERIRAAVKEGGSLLFFPEGTRSADGGLQQFKIGAFRTAVDEGLPIVPLVIRGTDQLLRKGAPAMAVERDQASRRCTLTILPVIQPIPVGDPKARAEDLRRRAHGAVHAELYGAGADAAPARPEAPAARQAVR